MFHHTSNHISNWYVGWSNTQFTMKKTQTKLSPKMTILCNVVMGHCRETYIINHRTFLFYFQVLTAWPLFDCKSIFEVFQIHSSILSKSISNTFFRSILKYYLNTLKYLYLYFYLKYIFKYFCPSLSLKHDQCIEPFSDMVLHCDVSVRSTLENVLSTSADKVARIVNMVCTAGNDY